MHTAGWENAAKHVTSNPVIPPAAWRESGSPDTFWPTTGPTPPGPAGRRRLHLAANREAPFICFRLWFSRGNKSATVDAFVPFDSPLYPPTSGVSNIRADCSSQGGTGSVVTSLETDYNAERSI